MESIQTGRTVDEAINKACEEFGIDREDGNFEFEIIDLPKKVLFGLKHIPAKVRVTIPDPPASKAQPAVTYLTEILKGFGLKDFSISVEEDEKGAVISLEGESLGVIIGRRGETLDALQYLAGLVVNKDGDEYFRVMVDSANYRQKREKTLTDLAKKISNSVLKTGRSVTLEPMNPYERRIIHAAVALVEGVSSKSIGDEPFRRVVVVSNQPRPQSQNRPPKRDGDKPRSGGGDRRGPKPDGADNRQRAPKPEGGDKPRSGGSGGRDNRPPRQQNNAGRPPRQNQSGHSGRGRDGGSVPVRNDAEMFERYAAKNPAPAPKAAEPQQQASSAGKKSDPGVDQLPLYGKIEL